jgi:selenium metabolism protein YedF
MSMITVECRGEQCPIPVVKTLKAIEGMKEAGQIQTHVDNETAVQNLTRLAQTKGFAVKAEKIEEGHFIVTMDASPAGAAPAAGEPAASCIPDRRGDTVYAFGSNCMGIGDEALGATLMKGFIYAVSQLEELPKTMLFYNGGAKLTVEGSASLEDLKSLQAQGVQILTCGTCLNFYGLSEKLAVGEVTNMYAIVDTLNKAAHIVKP